MATRKESLAGILLFFLVILLPVQGYSIETFPYLHWSHLSKGESLPDSGKFFDQLFLQSFQKSLKQLSRSKIGRTLKCSQVVTKMAVDFMTRPRLKSFPGLYSLLKYFESPFMAYLIFSPDISQRRWPHQQKIAGFGRFSENVKKSVYRRLTRYRFWKWMAPQFKIYGVYVSGDKIDHMIMRGLSIFLRYTYLTEVKKRNVFKSRDDAFDMELASELGKYGILSSAVVSFADLHANDQGFKMYRDLCAKKILSKVEGKWVMSSKWSLKKYMIPDLDESYQLSFYYNGQWPLINLYYYLHNKGLYTIYGKKISRFRRWVIKARYLYISNPVVRRFANIWPHVRPELKKRCNLQKSRAVQKLFKWYQARKVRYYAHRHLDWLIKKKVIPNPGQQSLQRVCQQRVLAKN